MIKKVLGAGVLFFCACGTADIADTGEQADNGEVADTGEVREIVVDMDSMHDVVHEFTFDDEEFTFRWLRGAEGNDWGIAIEEHIRLVDYRQALWREYGPVTSLEIFNAFSPEGLEPHPALVAAHEREASAMGRKGERLAVQSVDGRSLTIDKAIRPSCNTDILPDISPGQWVETQSTSVGVDGQYVYTCAGSPKRSGVIASPTTVVSCETFAPDRMLGVGICNDSSSQSTAEFWSFMGPLGSAQQQTSVSSNFFGRVILQPSPFFDNRSLRVIGRNGAFPDANFHRQVTGVGVF